MRPENQNIIDYAAVGDRIQRERLKCGFTPKELAEYSNIGVSAVNEIERGIRRVGLTNLVLIANTLNVGVECLLFGEQKAAEDRELSRREVKAYTLLNECTEEEQDAILQTMETMSSVFSRARENLRRKTENKNSENG